MYDMSVWSLKLEIGFLPLFLRSFVALCCFLGYLDLTAHSTHHNLKHFYQHCWTLNDVFLKNIVTLARFGMGSLMMVRMDRNM